jgi:LysM repeat protein
MGTTCACYEWYEVTVQDTCYAIEPAYGVTMAQLQAWNSELDAS